MLGTESLKLWRRCKSCKGGGTADFRGVAFRMLTMRSRVCGADLLEFSSGGLFQTNSFIFVSQGVVVTSTAAGVAGGRRSLHHHLDGAKDFSASQSSFTS